jgi:L-threonylcarbamoyladenylate synthase
MQIDKNVIELIKNGGVGILPTDTIYGVVASVFHKDAIEKIYRIKNRPKDKRLTMVIGNRGQLPSLGINLTPKQIEALNDLWPGPVSIDFKCDDTLDYLHLGFGSIAVRLPAQTWLRRLVNETGPIATTSANISGEEFLSDINRIKVDLPGLDFYIEGSVGNKQSMLGTLSENGEMFWIRRP